MLNININERNVCCKKGSFYFVLTTSYSNKFANIDNASTLGSQNSENKHVISKKKKEDICVCVF